MSKCKVQVFQFDNKIYKCLQKAITGIQIVLPTGGRTAHKDHSLTRYHSVHQSWISNDKFRPKDHVSLRSENTSRKKNVARGLSHC